MANVIPGMLNPANQCSGEKKEKIADNAIDTLPALQTLRTRSGSGSRMTEKSTGTEVAKMVGVKLRFYEGLQERVPTLRSWRNRLRSEFDLLQRCLLRLLRLRYWYGGR